MIKTKKNASDILGFENKLKQKEDIADENQRGLSFNRGFFYYLQKSNLVYECKSSSFDITNIDKISTWKSTGSFSSFRAGKGVIRAGKGTIRAGYGSKRPSLKNF